MQIVLTREDVDSAPEPVMDWLVERMGFVSSSSKDSKTKPKDKQKATPEVDVPSVKEVMNKAVELIESKGEDVLAEILKKLDIRRVKECPEEKRAALLAEIAVHA